MCCALTRTASAACRSELRAPAVILRALTSKYSTLPVFRRSPVTSISAALADISPTAAIVTSSPRLTAGWFAHTSRLSVPTTSRAATVSEDSSTDETVTWWALETKFTPPACMSRLSLPFKATWFAETSIMSPTSTSRLSPVRTLVFAARKTA